MPPSNILKTTLTRPQNNPLHISIFPSAPTGAPLRTPLQFSLLLSSTLDIFEARSRANLTSGGGLSGDYGLLHAIDERLAAYGFETNTGVRFVVVVDMRGREVAGEQRSVGLREADVKTVSADISCLSYCTRSWVWAGSDCTNDWEYVGFQGDPGGLREVTAKPFL